MSGVRFYCPGNPVPKGSMRAVFNKHVGRSILVSDRPGLGTWEKAVGIAARAAMIGQKSLVGAVQVHLSFWVPRPKSRSKDEWPTAKRGDVDKLVRGVLDAMTGIVYGDDGQVVRLVAEKRYMPREGSYAVPCLQQPGVVEMTRSPGVVVEVGIV